MSSRKDSPNKNQPPKNSGEDQRSLSARRLLESRTNAGYTQEALGSKLGFSANYIGEVERGNRPMTYPLAKRLSELFHLPLEFFLPSDEASLLNDTPPPQHSQEGAEARKELQQLLGSCTPEEIIIIRRIVQGFLDSAHAMSEGRFPSAGSDPAQPIRDLSGKDPHP